METNYINQRALAVWHIAKVFIADIQDSAKRIQEKIIFIQGAFSQNPALNPEEFKDDLAEIDVLNTEQVMKDMELARYQGVLAELKLLADMSKTAIDVPEAEKTSFEGFINSLPNMYAVDGNTLTHKKQGGAEGVIDKIRENALSPERLESTFKAVTQKRPN